VQKRKRNTNAKGRLSGNYYEHCLLPLPLIKCFLQAKGVARTAQLHFLLDALKACKLGQLIAATVCESIT
jgi:hypothetical protein